MAGKEKRGDYSFLVLMIFVIAFIVFTFLNKPDPNDTRDNIIGSAILSNAGQQTSSFTIGVTIVLIVIIVIFGFFFIRYKFKKRTITQPVMDKSPNLSEEQIDKLFTEDNKLNLPLISRKETAINTGPIEISASQARMQEPQFEQKFSETNELKSKLLEMINKNIPSQKILQNLVKLGYKRKEIDVAVEEINLGRLKSFVDKTLKQGYKKDIIAKALLKKKWSQSQVDRILKSQEPGSKEIDKIDLDLI